MTACAIEPSAGHEDGAAPAGCTLTVDGAYAARLASAGDSWFPERWTLDGPEPYAVPLPRNQPEEPGTEVQPMGDGRVLIHRLVARRHAFSLLYPTGPGTGELPLGAVECPDDSARLRLLPPAPGGEKAYALAVGPRSTSVWLVAGGAFGPERLAELPGRCSGGVWLDRTARLLALDRETGGRTKAVVVDLERGGEVSPLLQIAADSDDRLLLADHDSGLLIVRSDAPSPGQDRLGWGVLGSTLPVRFPECLRLRDCSVTPFAIQPGQMLTPESCAVALRVDGPAGSWIGVWRPTERRVHHLPAPEGWLAGSGLWTADGVLRLPYATEAVPCGVAQVSPPPAAEPEPESESGGTPHPETDVRTAAAPPEPGQHSPEAARPAPETAGGHAQPAAPASAPRPVPLQQAPLGRLVTNPCRLAWPSGSDVRGAG
ncbi:hypothetical protein [Streptomyces lomondensis]|uniref:Lipoprotein n=1 Tax=Streptomyces lomondensis TaxID=68229 RepID=A0ABQ2WZ35_9ACTN|nr:hypothetical protein [Streptomyces lomondensis]MCF0078742.1 hypothetical protein [Streptomyces lomondensis]GGW82493.1 hypothetical protein GCM10010383_08440 [Streptomyces lomondensis]